MPFGRSVTWGGNNQYYSDNIRFELEYKASPTTRLEVTFVVATDKVDDVARELAIAWNAHSQVQATHSGNKVTFGNQALEVTGIWVRTSQAYEIREAFPNPPLQPPAPTLLDNGLTIKNDGP